jgi:hypothetical protein
MEGRETYKIELTKDEIQEIIWSLEFVNSAHDEFNHINLIEELKGLLKNGK